MIRPERYAFIAALILIALAGCATAPPAPTVPPLDLVALADSGAPLSDALIAAERIPDVRTRVSVYARIAREYAQNGDGQAAAGLLDRTLLVVRLAGIASQIPDIMAEIADDFVLLKNDTRAVPILSQALADAAGVSDPFNRGLVLERIAESCIDAGAPAFDILRQTLQSIYIIEDLWTRATILTDIARRYQGNGQNISVDVLLQQAIPAAGSIANPWLKSLALSQIALRFRAAGNGDSARYYGGRAFDEITSVQVLRRTEADASRVVTVAQNLATLGLTDQAVMVLGTIEYSYLRAEGLATVGVIVAAAGNTSRGVQLCSQATDVAYGETSAYRRGEALGSIALAYGKLRQDRLALATADVALEIVPTIGDSSQRSDVVAAVAEAQMRWGTASSAFAAVDQIDDVYTRASSLITLAGRLLDDGLPSQAADSANAAAKLAPGAPYLQQNLYRGLADIDIRLGDYAGALAKIRNITDPYTLAVSLADLQSVQDAAHPLSVEDRAALRDIGTRLAVPAREPAAATTTQ